MEEGLIFDNDKGKVAGLQLAGIVDLGWNFNYGTFELFYDPICSRFEQGILTNNFAFGVGVETVLPCGLGADVMYHGILGSQFCMPIIKASKWGKKIGFKKEKKIKENNYKQEIKLGVFYDFRNLLFKFF